MKKQHAVIFFFFLTLYFPVRAQQQTVKIWPKLAPGSENVKDEEKWTDGKSVTNVYQPDITIFLPKQHEGPTPAILVCPGGGYRQVVMRKEGYKIAQWLNENGIAAFVLKYRLNRSDALRDAQRAISLIRHDAAKYHIDKNKIGVIGFSAGGNIAGNLAMNYENREIYDAIDSVSSRPDFWIGIYGAYRGIYGPSGEFGDRQNVPPAFLVHAGDDSKVPVLSSVQLYIDLKEHGVPAELHVYEHGEHGFALETDRGTAITSTVKSWSTRCLEWLKLKGFI